MPSWGQAVYPSWRPSLTKDCKQDRSVLGVIWQTQSIMVQTRDELTFQVFAINAFPCSFLAKP